MEYFTAVVEVSKRGNLSGDEVDQVMDRLAGHAVSLSVSPRGFRAARITVPADNLAQAATAAVLAVTHGYGMGVNGAVSLEVMSEVEADLRSGSLEVPELIGVTEAAEILELTPQRVRQMIESGKLKAHRVGERSFALVRSEVEIAKSSRSIPVLREVVRERGFELRDLVGDPRFWSTIEYGWATPDGESFESEEPPPPGTPDVEQREVRHYEFAVLGRHEGGLVATDVTGREATQFTVIRPGDWTSIA